jgi:hypothetical protein
MIDVWHGTKAIIQHWDLYVVPWHKTPPICIWIQHNVNGWLIEINNALEENIVLTENTEKISEYPSTYEKIVIYCK